MAAPPQRPAPKRRRPRAPRRPCRRGLRLGGKCPGFQAFTREEECFELVGPQEQLVECDGRTGRARATQVARAAGRRSGLAPLSGPSLNLGPEAPSQARWDAVGS